MSPTRCVAAEVCPLTWKSKHDTPCSPAGCEALWSRVAVSSSQNGYESWTRLSHRIILCECDSSDLFSDVPYSRPRQATCLVYNGTMPTPVGGNCPTPNWK